MNITRIGSFVFDNSTNIITDVTSQELPGVGLRVQNVMRQTPISFRVAFIRSTKALVDGAVNQFVREMYGESMFRPLAGFAAARRGVQIWFDAAQTISTLLLDAEVRTVSIENVSQGVMATLEIRGVLAYPPMSEAISVAISQLASFEIRDEILGVATNNELVHHNYVLGFSNHSNIRDLLFVVETRPNSTAAGSITTVNATSTSGNFFLSTWLSGTRKRYTLTSGTGGTVTYSVGALPYRPMMLFANITAAASSGAPYFNIAWTDQPAITEPIYENQTIYPIGVYTRGAFGATITIELFDVPVDTYVDPIVLIPLEGAYSFYARRAGGIQNLRIINPYFATGENLASTLSENCEVYGNPNIITSDFVRFGYFTNISSSVCSINALAARRISSALFI